MAERTHTEFQEPQRFRNMKPYFAKYLPVEEEIKEGDITTNCHGDFFKADNGTVYFLSKELKKYKLFLCSRDIQIGDIVFCRKNLSLGEHAVKESEFPDVIEWEGETCTPDDLLKRIGEISPEATWVKEGDEFDEDQWRLYNEVVGMVVSKSVVAKYDNRPNYLIEILGPCGHFH